MDEHQRAGRLGRLPERLEAVVAEEDAADARGHLHAAQHAALHHHAKLAGRELRVLERERT